MYHHDYLGARAHAARIRAEHEYEATELDATRRRTLEYQAKRARRVSLARRVRSLLARRPLRARRERTCEEPAATRP
jgi:hypothetical protein